MTATTQTISDVTCLIQQETLLLVSLTDILKEEKKALCLRQPDVLTQNAKQKAQLIIELEKFSTIRSMILTNSGFENSKQGWATLLDDLKSQGTSLDTEWSTLRSLIQKTHDLNLVNAKIVNRTKLSTERFLSIFKGKSEAPELYNQLGSKSSKIKAYTVQAPVVKA